MCVGGGVARKGRKHGMYSRPPPRSVAPTPGNILMRHAHRPSANSFSPPPAVRTRSGTGPPRGKRAPSARTPPPGAQPLLCEHPHTRPPPPSPAPGAPYRGTSLIRNDPGAVTYDRGGGAVSYERGTPVRSRAPSRCEAAPLHERALALLTPSCPVFRVQGLGFRVQGYGVRV